MVRKFSFAIALFALVGVAVGSIFAEEIKAVFVKSDDKTITVKIDDKEKTYKYDAEKKIKIKIKDEEKEVTIGDMLKRRKADDKVTLTVEDGNVVNIKGDRKGKDKGKTEPKKEEPKKDAPKKDN